MGIDGVNDSNFCIALQSQCTDRREDKALLLAASALRVSDSAIEVLSSTADLAKTSETQPWLFQGAGFHSESP